MGFWQQLAVYAALVGIALTGLVWFIIHDLIESEPDELQHLLLVLHGTFAYAGLIVLGSLLPLHVRGGWQRRHNRQSGVWVIGVMTILVVTALVLYYGGEDTRLPARWTHIAVGLGCLLLVPLHIVLGYRTRRLRRRDAAAMAGATDLATDDLPRDANRAWAVKELAGG